MTGGHLASTTPSTQSRHGNRGDETGGAGGHPPQTTLTRSPLLALVTGHEILLFCFGSAQKIRVWGGCPPAPPSRRFHRLASYESRALRAGEESASGGGWGGGLRRERMRRAVARPEAQGVPAARAVPAKQGGERPPSRGMGGQAGAPERGGARGEELERTTQSPAPPTALSVREPRSASTPTKRTKKSDSRRRSRMYRPCGSSTRRSRDRRRCRRSRCPRPSGAWAPAAAPSP